MVGRFLESRSRLPWSRHLVGTDHRVQVERVLKGDVVRDGEHIIVSLPGGMVKFPDGTWAQTIVPNFIAPTEGERFLLFLTGSVILIGEESQKFVGDTPMFVPTSFGLFRVREGDSRIEPRGDPSYPLCRLYTEASFEKLFADVTSAVAGGR